MLHEWKYPKYKDMPNDLSKVTDEMMEEWELEYKECNEFNDNLRATLLASKNHLMTSAGLLFGANSSVVAYLKKQKIDSPSRIDFDDLKSRVTRAKIAEAGRIKELEINKSKESLTVKAINWLTERGYSFGGDFSIHDAIDFANTRAFNEEVLRRVQEIETTGDPIEFEGNDTCENCRGWNGTSTRCQCGNRKVTWNSDECDDFFLDPHIFGRA